MILSQIQTFRLSMEQRGAGGDRSPSVRDSTSPEERGESPASGKTSHVEVNGSPAGSRSRVNSSPLRPLGGEQTKHTNKTTHLGHISLAGSSADRRELDRKRASHFYNVVRCYLSLCWFSCARPDDPCLLCGGARRCGPVQ